MTDFRQRQVISTLTAPAARGLSPHSLVQPGTRHALYPATGIKIFTFSAIKQKGYGALDLKRAEHHHNHSWQIFHRSQQFSRLASQTMNYPAFSGCPPMTGFHQRIIISMPTVLVKCGDLDKILTPFPYVAPAPGISVFTAKEPLFDSCVYYSAVYPKMQ